MTLTLEYSGETYAAISKIINALERIATALEQPVDEPIVEPMAAVIPPPPPPPYGVPPRPPEESICWCVVLQREDHDDRIFKHKSKWHAKLHATEIMFHLTHSGTKSVWNVAYMPYEEAIKKYPDSRVLSMTFGEISKWEAETEAP